MIVNLADDLTANTLSEIEWFERQVSHKIMEQNVSGNRTSVNSHVLETTELKDVIQKYINEYSIKVLGEEPKLHITASWLNSNPPGSHHHKHPHPNSKISGCLYLNVSDDTGKFNIYKPEALSDYLTDTKIEYNKYNYEYVWFAPKRFDLYLFPSYLQHSVDTNTSNMNRVSLAFNTFYTLPIGHKTTYLCSDC